MDPRDIEIANPPTDCISSLDFSPQADFLAASSWDNQVRIYEVQQSGNAVPKAMYAHQGPALCVTWSTDGTKLVSGGADKIGKMYDINTGQSTQIAQHDDTISCVKFLHNQPIVATGSWDKMLKYWDLRSPQPIGTVQLPERCYAMDVQQSLLVIGTAERHITIIDTNNPTTVFKKTTSPLKWQTKTIACFQLGSGYAVGSIEGRVGIQYLNEKEQSKNFSFKCHRDDNTKSVYSVNAISFHPVYNTFSTAGADGTVSFWDKDTKQRLMAFGNVNNTVTCTAFNRNGTIFAYGVGYDWSKGYKHANPAVPQKLYLHAVREENIKPKKKR